MMPSMRIVVPATALLAVLIATAQFRAPAKIQFVEPSLPLMGSVGLGILIGGIVIGTILYLWKRPK